MTPLEAALQYASDGFAVFPAHSIRDGACSCGGAACSSPAKHPRVAGGLNSASTDSDAITAWWTQWPDANVAIRTGSVSGLWVVDIDPKNGGDASWEALVAEIGTVPDTVVCRTGSGGRHFYFTIPPGDFRNRAKRAIGIDVRGDGGYVIAPPSNHVSGASYAWADEGGLRRDRLADAPSALLAALYAEPAPRCATAPDRPRRRLLAHAERYIDSCDSAPNGDRNNNALRIAGHLLSFVDESSGTRLTEADVLPLALRWNQRNAEPLSTDEIEQVVASAVRNGTPRTPHIVQGPVLRADSPPEDWPEPQPLPDGLPPVAPFDYAMLPDIFRPWIKDIAERMQCPPDYAAVAIMVVIASIVGRKIAIRPKRFDNWEVIVNLWGVVVGPPGVMKSPAVREPLRLIEQREKLAADEDREAQQRHREQQFIHAEQKKIDKTAVSKALKAGEDPTEIAQRAAAVPIPPIRRRYMTNDPTVEKLGELLNENSNGILIVRDEMSGLLKSLDKPGQEAARSFYVEAWNGSGRFTYDRIGRGTIEIEAAIVSIIGCIQPGPLRSYLHGAISDSAGADGLIQRFQLAVYPDVTREWVNIDRVPDGESRAAVAAALDYLEELSGTVVGVESNLLEDARPYLRFCDEAQEVFDAWRSALEHRLRANDEHPAFIAHLSKFRSLVPSLALLCHVADRATGPVSLQSLNRALQWATYLESHARRIYATVTSSDVVEGRALAARILDRSLPTEFELRRVYRRGWVGLSDRDSAQRGAQLLCDLEWLIERTEQTGGRPRTVYVVNPRVFKMPPET